jgi:hypothetical protein
MSRLVECGAEYKLMVSTRILEEQHVHAYMPAAFSQ